MELNNEACSVVVGLGYIGLPLAIALADHFDPGRPRRMDAVTMTPTR